MKFLFGATFLVATVHVSAASHIPHVHMLVVVLGGKSIMLSCCELVVAGVSTFSEPSNVCIHTMPPTTHSNHNYNPRL